MVTKLLGFMEGKEQKTTNKIIHSNDTYEKDYSDLFQDFSDGTIPNPANIEWRMKGEFFEKFSIYESYPFTTTSNSTTLIK